MKKINKTIKIAMIFIVANLYCQSYIIDYKYTIPNGSELEYNLTTNFSQSVFLNKSIQLSETQNVIAIKNDLKYFIYKNLDENELLVTDFISNKRFIIEEELPLMNWDLLSNESISILHFKCFPAKTNFRGREYIAYFTPDIPISNGPWKFQGLPGLILRVFSIDNEYNYEATKISELDNNYSLEKPVFKENKINWLDFSANYNSYLDRLIGSLKSDEGSSEGTNYYKIDKMEIINEDAQTGSGIEF